MKNFSILLFFVFILSACSTSKVPPPTEEETFDEVKIALITILEDGTGDVGCGDKVEVVNKSTQGQGNKVKAALEELFSIKSSHYGESGLYNALYQSNLKVSDVVFSGSILSVSLKGSIQSGGVCDDPRIEAQIRETIAENAPAGSQIVVALDGKELSEYFNLK